MRIGFAGLGLMGAPMAANLARIGPLAVYNRSPAPRAQLALLGAAVFEEPAALFAAADIILLMLADDAAVDTVIGRGTASFGRRVGGKIIVNMGTHAPDWSRSLGRDISEGGGRFVEAPVSGSAKAAQAASLIAMVAGTAEDIAAVRPVLANLVREQVATGAIGSALATKLAVNLYLIASVAALAEAAELARRSGVDLESFARVIGEGPLGSDVARGKLAKIAASDFAPEAAIADVCKNARLVGQAARRAALPSTMLDLARARFEQVRTSGGAELDMAAVITVFEEERR